MKRRKKNPAAPASIDHAQPLPNMTSGTIGAWSVVPAPRKSSACPICTPRCPHGYPADDLSPQITWTYYSGNVPFTLTNVSGTSN